MIRSTLLFAICLAPLALAEAEHDIYDEKADGREQIDAALAEAKTQDKHVLIVWGANWCGWCHRLEGVMQNDPSVRELLEDDYILVHIDLGHRTKHMDLAREYGCDFDAQAIAHSTILNQDGEAIAQMPHAKLLVDTDGDRVHSAALIADFLEKNKKTAKTESPEEPDARQN